MDRKEVGDRVGGWLEKAIAIVGLGFCLVATSLFLYTFGLASAPFCPFAL